MKNWADKQHYKERRPPWIKLYAKLLQDNEFGSLTEIEQWQLVRIWLVASRSELSTLDEAGREVPVVSATEETLRRAICSIKRIPIAKFISDGWLIPVASTALAPALAPCLHDASTGASALLDTEEQRFRGTENQGLSLVIDEALAEAKARGAA